jgi:uncharacterized protein (DUF58 family)
VSTTRDGSDTDAEAAGGDAGRDSVPASAVEESVEGARGPDSEGVATIRSEIDRRTGRWKGVSALALLAGAAGILFRQPELLLSAVVGVGYEAYARVGSAPGVSVVFEREFDVEDPDPGDEVTVTLSVTNRGDRLPDLRIVDDVPDALPVVEGTPRLGTALQSGGTDEVSYTVRAKRGRHEFDSVKAIVRGFSGAVERELELATDDDLVCTPSATPTREVPLRELTSRYTGRVETSDGGEGVEFFATREYRPGDSLSRIDWNRHARTGELATLEFRQERAATVMLVLDLRSQAYLRETDEGLHGADRGVDAASQVFAALLESGDRVGVTAFSPGDVWLQPGTGNEHRARVRELFATHPGLSPEIPEERVSVTIGVRRLRRRLPGDAQVILFSPLCDDGIARGARLLDAHGHLVTIVSPDPTGEGTPGQELARAERTARMTDLRGKGVRVVDWSTDEPLATAIDRASRRWSG